MEAIELYSRRFTRRYPGLFIILLDQSLSMSEKISGETYTKADLATTALNNIIYAMADAAGTDPTTGDPKKLAYLSVLGYGETVTSLLTKSGDPIDIALLRANPRGEADMAIEVYDSVRGGYRTIVQRRPVWIEAKADGRKTEMTLALKKAQEVARQWLASAPEAGQAPRQDCFPPIIVNITDAEHNGSGNPVAIAQNIQREGTQQGTTLIFTCHFTPHANQSHVFPRTLAEAQALGEHAARMFEMSSPIPGPLLVKASEVADGKEVLPGARSFIYNANTDVLVRFLKWGTLGTLG